jgi:preprotein translocase subunit SecE
MLSQKYKKVIIKAKSLTLLTIMLMPFIMSMPTYALVVPSPVGGGTTGSSPTSGTSTSTGTTGCTDGTYNDGNGNCVCPPGTTANSDGSTGCEDSAVKCSSGNCDLIDKYVNPAITLFGAVFGTIAVISLIIGGIQYSSSEGDPQKVANAKKRVTNTIISVIAFLFLYSFLQFLVPGGIFNR